MTSKSEILEKMSEVLNESEWDNLSINFENGRGIEFANFEQEEIMYNAVKIDEQGYIDALEEDIDLEIVSSSDNGVIFRRDNNESVEKYLKEMENILDIIDSSREGISTMELKNIT